MCYGRGIQFFGPFVRIPVHKSVYLQIRYFCLEPAFEVGEKPSFCMVLMIALMEPPMIGLMAPFFNANLQVSDGSLFSGFYPPL